MKIKKILMSLLVACTIAVPSAYSLTPEGEQFTTIMVATINSPKVLADLTSDGMFTEAKASREDDNLVISFKFNDSFDFSTMTYEEIQSMLGLMADNIRETMGESYGLMKQMGVNMKIVFSDVNGNSHSRFV